ncbi:MAG: single-stranded-DNA-specific exonuclease RecJ [Pseudomonadota bacterium]|nr:single-stranded-DNA-specific exonuclease RecJ [Pseudomonadota bacterium]
MQSIQLEQRSLQQALGQYEYLGSDTLARILSARDTTVKQLDLQLKHLLQPVLMGLDKAVQILDQAIDKKQKILIVGDYDADGATSTALAVLALQAMGATVNYIVPDRFKYGYGLTPAIAELAYERFQPDVLMTVDNGISSHTGVERCHALGMQVIITDHHLTTKATPKAEAVVNPNQLGCTFASKSLAGVGVAFYLLARLATHRQKLDKSGVRMTQFLDLVALGTVADVAKLDFNNRILVQAGLERIRQGQCRAGILALIEIAGKNAAQLQASDFGFVLGPRINAAGRMNSMQIGIECLLAPDLNSAYPYAYQLDRLNIERRQVEQGMREQAFDYLQQIHIEQDQLPEALVLFEPEWHQGVIGIVAGRLKEHFHRPSIVFALDEDGEHLKGSARSIAGIHIRDAIEAVAEQHPQLVKFFGGHAMAAGLTIQKENFDAFRQAFIDVVAQVNSEVFQARIYTDGTLKKDELNLNFLQRLEQLGPWGQGFESPIFEGIFQVVDYQWLKEKHLKLKLQIDVNHRVEAIGFNFIEKIEQGEIAPKVRIAYSLEKNEFRGQMSLQLRLIHCENVL